MSMSTIFSMLLVLAPAPPGRTAPADTLQCRVLASADQSRRCSVRLPAGRTVRACIETDSSAGRCTRTKKAAYVAWVAPAGGAKCRISGKRTQWKRKVTVVMSKETTVGAGSCSLYVVLR